MFLSSSLLQLNKSPDRLPRVSCQKRVPLFRFLLQDLTESICPYSSFVTIYPFLILGNSFKSLNMTALSVIFIFHIFIIGIILVSWRQHPTKQDLYANLPPITKTIQVRRSRHVDSAGEVGTNSYVTYSCGPLHKDEPRQDDQLEPTYSSFLPIRDVSMKRCPWCNGYRRRNWTRRHEFKFWTRLIAYHIALIPLGKV